MGRSKDFHIWINNVWKRRSNKENNIKNSHFYIWSIRIRISIGFNSKMLSCKSYGE